MATILKRFMDDIIGEPDPRNLHLPLVSGGPLATIVTIVMFLMTVKVWGPRYMHSRKAYDLKACIQGLNIIQILVNAWIVKEILMNFELSTDSWCIRMNTASHGKGLHMARAMYVYYIMKFVDMADSVMFILRKKFNQLSFLHVFHHVSTLLLAYVAVMYNPGGPSAIIQLMNSLVHVTMYFYYFLSSFGPRMQKYLWWKKYLTTFQIIQFFVIIAFCLDQIAVRGCDDRAWFNVYMGGPIILVNLVLFSAFYTQSYTKKSSTETNEKETTKKSLTKQTSTSKESISSENKTKEEKSE